MTRRTLKSQRFLRALSRFFEMTGAGLRAQGPAGKGRCEENAGEDRLQFGVKDIVNGIFPKDLKGEK